MKPEIGSGTMDDEINLYKNGVGLFGMISLIESRVEGVYKKFYEYSD